MLFWGEKIYEKKVCMLFWGEKIYDL